MSDQQVFLRLAFCLSLLLLAFGQRFACAATAMPPDASGLVRQAHARQLERHPYWMALLHYRHKASGDFESEILSPDFFLAPGGAKDPAAELAATLAALLEPAGRDADEHAQCRFVARFKWLRKTLDWGSISPPAIHCPRYKAYSADDQVESLSLVYATGYLSNPASFYGHILLKLNTRRSIAASELLDQSVNYGAAVPDDENPVVYVVKGLFGGYHASFSHQQFFNFNHLYAENDLRDMWEYELSLTREEVDQLVSHSWEILGKRHAYFFLDDNCAYRMAKLLELVIDEPLVPELPWSLPSAVFERLAALERDGAPLVRAVRRIPSRHSRFREGFLALGEDHRRVAQQLVEQGLDTSGVAYRALPDAAKIGIVDTLLDYYEYRIAIDRDDADTPRAKRRLMIERAALPARQAPLDAAGRSRAAPPHEGPLPLMLRLGPVRNSRLGSGIRLRARPANYDSLALDAGRIAHSTLTMFDLELAHLDGHWMLRSLDAINIENLNIASSPLHADGGWAWKLRAGLESQSLDCRGCNVAKLEGGIGKAALLARQIVAFGMLDLSVQSARDNSGTVAAAPRVGLIASPAAGWKTRLEISRRRFFDGRRSERRITRWENRFGGSRRWDIRVAYEKHVAREAFAGLSLYW